MRDDKVPWGQGWFYSTDSAERSAAAYLIVIGGSVALAIWVSPWFWILAVVVLVLTTTYFLMRARRSRRR